MRDLKTLRREIYQIYYILDNKQRIQMIGMLLVITIGSFFEMLGVSALLPFIQSILEPSELLNNKYISRACSIFGVNTDFKLITMVGVGIILIYVLKNIYLSFSAYLQALYSNNTKKHLSVLMMKAFMRRQYSFFVQHSSGVIMRGVAGDIDGVYYVLENGFKLAAELLVMLFVAIYLIMTDALLAMGVLAVGISCLILVVYGFKNKLSQMSLIFQNASVDLYKWMTQISTGIKDIFVFGRQKFFLKSYEDSYEGLRIAGTYSTFINMLPERIIEAICVSGIITMVIIRLGMGVNPREYVPKMAVFAMGAFRLMPSISRSTGYMNYFVYYRERVESAYENIKEANLINTAENNNYTLEHAECESGDIGFDEKVEICGIQWRYSESTDNVLEDISISISKGEAIGIIGESGSGKSTLADIMLRLYHPQKGYILMDGRNIDDIPETWIKMVGYVPQSVFLIDDTIRENVLFGSDDRDDQRVWDSLRKASLDRFVLGLPDGLDTIVGERGVKFSGGQRQRIAIARALYDNPQILILDEATSALDNETEEAVMEAIDALAGTMTLIIIAHRVTTLRNCDKIYEISKGKAIARNKEEVLGYEDYSS